MPARPAHTAIETISNGFLRSTGLLDLAVKIIDLCHPLVGTQLTKKPTNTMLGRVNTKE